MAQEREYFVLCKDKCLFPAMDKEQTLTAIQQAVSTGTIQDIDAGFITKIQELNANNQLQFWVGTTAQYNALTEKAENTLYLLTDDNGFEPNVINNHLSELDTKADNLAEKVNNIENGTTKVPKASEADTSTKATTTDFSNAIWTLVPDRAYVNTMRAGRTHEIGFVKDNAYYSSIFTIPADIPSSVTRIRIAQFNFGQQSNPDIVDIYAEKSESSNLTFALNTTNYELYGLTNFRWRQID